MFRALRNLRRLARIGITLARYDAVGGLDPLGTRAALALAARLLRRHDLPPRPGQRLAAALTALGPSFIKLGQALSTRADLVGEAVATDLSALQDKLAPFPADDALTTVAAEFGQPVAALFAEFDDVPVAAASIAQVHFARTADGAEVAVKILRPGVEGLFARDIDLFLWLAQLLERHVPRIRRLKPVAVVRSFEDTGKNRDELR